MQAARYHRSPDGQWRPCGAKNGSCPYGADDHLDAAGWAERLSHKPGYRHHADAPRPTFDLLPGNPAFHRDPIRVAPAGFTGKYCDECYSYLTRDVLDAVSDWDLLTCPSCKAQLTVNELPVDIRTDEMKYAEDAVVRKAHWFHITDQENWIEGTLSEGVMTHLGSRESAMERLTHLTIQNRPYATGEDEDEDTQFYLYEVALNPEIPIAPGIYEDQEVRWPETIDQAGQGRYQHIQHGGVTRYMNDYEGPGTISLIADPRSYTLVTCVPIPKPDRKQA